MRVWRKKKKEKKKWIHHRVPSHTVLFKLILFDGFLVLPCLSVFLSQTQSPYCWADKALVWSALICQSLQRCYLFMNSQRRDPPSHVSAECEGGSIAARPASKPSEPQHNPPQKLKVSHEAAARPALSGNIPAAKQHAILFSDVFRPKYKLSLFTHCHFFQSCENVTTVKGWVVVMYSPLCPILVQYF